MKLHECTLGKLIYTVDSEGEVSHVGMIMGITNNRQNSKGSERVGEDYAIPLVKMSCENTPRGIHPTNIKDYSKYIRGY